MISIIVPVYNGKRFIDSFVESVKGQSFSDYEIVFVNDGSTDGSDVKLAEIANDTDIKVVDIYQENAGVSAARNRGIRESHGEYLCFCDIDDLIQKDYLSGLFATISDGKADMGLCTYAQMKNGKIVENGTTEDICVMSGAEAIQAYLDGKLNIGCWSSIIKKEVLIDSGITYPEGYKHYEDVFFLYKCMSCCKYVAYYDKPLYLYCLQSLSATSVFNEERLKGIDLIRRLTAELEAIKNGAATYFGKYAEAKYIWTMSWQAAIYLDKKEFLSFCKKLNVKASFKKLLGFTSKKVALSSFVGIVSLRLFRFLARWKGLPLINYQAGGNA